MNISGIQSGLVGMAIFDIYMNGLRKSNEAHRAKGSPLVAAAAQAFESYLNGQIAVHSAQVQAVGYMLNPSGASAALVTSQQMAPFLALNIMA